MDLETRTWTRAYAMAGKMGYTDIRDCRIVAMAYTMGWLNGRKCPRLSPFEKKIKRIYAQTHRKRR